LRIKTGVEEKFRSVNIVYGKKGADVRGWIKRSVGRNERKRRIDAFPILVLCE
jgi:hypothetical protein